MGKYSNMQDERNDAQAGGNVQIDWEQGAETSEAFKREVRYDQPDRGYEDIEYHCIKCRQRAVFTAEEQQDAIGNYDNYTHRLRLLCTGCWHEMNEIAQLLNERAERFEQNKEVVLDDRDFLVAWANDLFAYAAFGQPLDQSLVEFIRKQLNPVDQQTVNKKILNFYRHVA